jgi:hypothetical protein
MNYRKKPVEIEAHRITVFNIDWIAGWCGGKILREAAAAKYRMIQIPTLEGSMLADVGDWIIKGVKGEFYPCKHEIFEMTYEEVKE